ncbi:hypothetical protein [Pseudonocardia endophytica]|uniref:Uncharacterized protein n=1 Tax=Pseudonocardia endophytica TaxID=401976 RepID=A0A4R1HS17_PSEEN|nr:hypothetical protein [Pseudonocardia endophytica]TCK24968.1 hypothetical protein EV378_0764 [Pseudonocardia endophytica]
MLPALFPAVLTALAAIAGVVIGRFWETRSEIGRHKRDRRVAAYENVCGHYFEIRERIRKLSTTVPSSVESYSARTEVLEMGAKWNKAVATVWLHSTADVCRSLGELDHRLTESVHRALDRRYSWDEWRVERQFAEEGLEAFLEAVRVELRRPPVPVRLRTFSVEDLESRIRDEQARR